MTWEPRSVWEYDDPGVVEEARMNSDQEERQDDASEHTTAPANDPSDQGDGGGNDDVTDGLGEEAE